jgi:SdpI/YfhL protein family
MHDYRVVVISGIFTLLTFGCGLPLALGQVRRNRWFGFKLNTYIIGDDDIWYAVNRVGGRILVAASALFLTIAVIAAVYVENHGMQTALLFITLGLILAVIVYSFSQTLRLSYRMADEKGLRSKPPSPD